MNETGSVKFSCQHIAKQLRDFDGFAEMNVYRHRLFDLGLIGVDANGVGFGNISIRRDATTQFYITGSATGKLSCLTPSHYAMVVAHDFEKNWVQCEGATIASSESLTHAAVYECSPAAKAVIHCHDMELWTALQNRVPTTPQKIDYGTPEMAYAVQHLFATTDVIDQKVFIMSAHDGGIVTFGKDLQEAFGVLTRLRTA